MSGERGSAAILAIIMMMLLGSLGATLLMLSKTDVQIATNHRDGISAQYLAEAGIQCAIVKLKTDDSFISQTEKYNQVITSQSFDIIPIAGNYSVQIGPDSRSTSIYTRLITATGIVNHAKRQIVVNITLPMKSTESSPFIMIWND